MVIFCCSLYHTFRNLSNTIICFVFNIRRIFNAADKANVFITLSYELALIKSNIFKKWLKFCYIQW